MKFLILMSLILFLTMLLCAEVKIGMHTVTDIFQRVIPCIIGSIIVTLIIGLPILGIISMF